MNLKVSSKVCEAAPISLFWASNGLNELPEVSFEFPFTLIGKSEMAFFYQVNHGAYSNPGTQVGAKNMDFGAVSQTTITTV